MNKRSLRFTVILTTLALLVSMSSAAWASGEKLPWQVVASGGSKGSSGSYKLNSTIGQTATGQGTSGSYKLHEGFWQNFTAPCTSCGDADGSGGAPDISDAVFLIAYIFGSGPTPGPCGGVPDGLGDADGSGGVDISDAVYLIAYIFGGGPAPHCP